MKKLSLMLVLCILPINAFAERFGPSTCETYSGSGNFVKEIPLGYCCISYYENGSYTESLWNCDNLNLDATTMASCKSERTNCIDYCNGTYDLDNNTCGNNNTCTCNQWRPNWELGSTDCTIPNAATCDYELLCDMCGCGICKRGDSEDAMTCIEGYYTTEDYQQCLPCPGDGVVDPDLISDVESVGIAACYIPRNPPLTGSDETGTWKYTNNKCHYKE